MENNTIIIAKKYFELSNNGNLEEIGKMFTSETNYNSENLGSFLGTNDIMEMMNSFFSSFKNLNWEIKNITQVSDHKVRIDFLFIGKKVSGEAVSIEGIEYITVMGDKIQNIEIHNK